MFEKEAEEYATKECCTTCKALICKEKCECWTFANKGQSSAITRLMNWHRVSDKLPEMDVLVYLWKKGKDFPVIAYRHFPYGQKEWVWNCEWGSGFSISQLKGRDYLWKEIVLPKESEMTDDLPKFEE